MGALRKGETASSGTNIDGESQWDMGDELMIYGIAELGRETGKVTLPA